MNIKRGITSQIIPVRIVDGNGLPKTGLGYNATGLSAAYQRELDAAPTAITLATMTAGTWATGGFIELNASSMPGVYALGVPNAALGSSDASTWCIIQIVGTAAANLYAQPLRIDLVAYDPQNANLGLSAVTADVTKWNGTAVATPATAGIPDVNAKNLGGTSQTGRDIGLSVLLSPGTGTGQLDITSGVVKSNLVQILATALTETGGYLAAAFKKFFNVATPIFTAASMNQTGDSFALIGTAGEGLTALGDPRLNDLDAAISSRLAPTTAGHTLDVSATGEAGMDLDNIKQATAPTTLANITVPTVTTTATATDLTNNNPTIGNVVLAALQPNYDIATIDNQLAINDNVLLIPRNPLLQTQILSDSGTAQAGTLTNIQLRTGAPAVSLVGQTVFVYAGTGAGQSSPVTAYDTATKDAVTTWVTAPDATSQYVIIAAQGGSSGGGSGDVSSFSGPAAAQIDAIQTTGEDVLARIASGTWTVISPTSTNVDGTITVTLTKGDDYYAANGFDLVFGVPAGYADLTGASAVLELPPNLTPVTAYSVDNTSIKFNVPHATTQYLAKGDGQQYAVVITLLDTHILTPIIGILVAVVRPNG